MDAGRTWRFALREIPQEAESSASFFLSHVLSMRTKLLLTLLLIVIGAYAFAAPTSRASGQQDSPGILRETSPGPTEELIRQFDSGRTRRDKVDAMSRLSVRQRSVLYLGYWLDLTVDEIASTLTLSRRSTERALTTARSQLQEQLR